jgi:hypothetical protein
MNLSDKKVLRVARAICYAAGTEYNTYCPVCDPNEKMLGPNACIMTEQFKREAEAAIKAVKGY